jgi:glycosyltransferase involved in cell wall biosynthesis
MSGGTRSYEFARRLVAQGHEVSIVTADPAPNTSTPTGWRQSTEAGIEVHWISVPYDNSMSFWRRLLAFTRFLLAASRKAAILPQDVVLATSTPLTVSIPGAWSAYRNKVPFVLEVRDLWPTVPIALGVLRSWPLRKLALALEKWSYRRADRIIALSPDMAAGVREVRGDVPLSVIPNASDRDLFSVVSLQDDDLAADYPWLEGRPVVLYAGAFGRVNGVGYLVEVAAELATRVPEAVFVLVGGGAEFQAVRELARKRGVLNTNCLVLDRVPKNQVVAWFRRATIATSTVIDVPELAGNSANKVFDAFAAGRPVAINHGGWLADVLQRTGAGLVLPSADPAVAAVMLASFLASEDRIASARKEAQRLALESFDRDQLAKEFEGVLRAAVADRAGCSSDGDR